MTYPNMVFFEQARANLTSFVIHKALKVQREVGFGYRDDAVAPQTDEELMQAWAQSKRDGTAFPVWSGASDSTIYTNRGGNYAFRFWHDSLHARLGLSTPRADEVKIGEMHVDAVAAEFGEDSLEAILMHWDTVGQSNYCDMYGEFPSDQLMFVREMAAQTIVAHFKPAA